MKLSLCVALLAGAAAAAPVQLQSATATFSQPAGGGPWLASHAIDGSITSSPPDGWAIDPMEGQTQVAAFQTAANVGFPAGTALTFKLSQIYGASHLLGRFRFSVTTADRSQFCDGAQSNGNLGAPAIWTPLANPRASGPAGMVFTAQPDQSVLVSGAIADQATYTVSYTTSIANITGVRLEAIADPSLPHSGPGLQPNNGNFVLTELQLSAEAALPADGLELWLRADQGVVTDAAGDVAQWVSQAPPAHALAPNDKAGPALVQGAAPGGGAVVRFDGATTALSTGDAIFQGNSYTVFTVMSLRGPYPWIVGLTSAGNHRFGYEGSNAIDNYGDGQNRFETLHEFGNDAMATLPGIGDSSWKVLTNEGSGSMSGIQVWMNGTPAQMSVQNSDVPIDFIPGLSLGYVYGGENIYTAMDLAEMIVYTRALSTSERQAVESYLLQKYAGLGGGSCIAVQQSLDACNASLSADQAAIDGLNHSLAAANDTIASLNAQLAASRAQARSLVLRLFGEPADRNVATAARDAARAELELAVAQGRGPAGEVAEARKRCDAGQAALAAGRWERSLVAFRACYEEAEELLTRR